jgi:hypothetical protein
MNPRVTVGLLVVLIALGAYYFYGSPPAAAPAASAPGAAPGAPTPKPADPSLDFWALDDTQFQTVSVKQGGQSGKEAGVQRSGEDWQLIPSGEPADRLRVNSLIFRLATLKATYKVPNATNDADFGLATPALVAMLKLASGETHTLTFGTKAPAESGTYVRKDADPGIYLVSNALADDLTKLVTEPPRPPSPTPLASPAASPSPTP